MSAIEKKICIVVGDIYLKFCEGTNAITATEAVEILSSELFADEFEELILGQGLSISSIEMLTVLARVQKIKCTNRFENINNIVLTHKTETKNIIISAPEKLTLWKYKFDLLIDDSVDRLSDHVTGRHIGGMLLMEAARQGVVSVLEIEYPKRNGTSWGYVLERFNTKYHRYAFPVPTEIIIEAEKNNQVSESQHEVSLIILISQSGFVVSSMEMEVRLFSDRVLSKIERKLSRQSVNDIHSYA